VNQAIVKAFDGVRVLEPWIVYLKPMHEDPELSWFETTGRAATETAEGRSKHRWWSRLKRVRARLARPRAWGRRGRHRRAGIQGKGAAPASGS